MESGMMKVAFSSINKGNRGALSANGAASSRPEPAVHAENRFKPEIKYSQPKTGQEEFRDKSSREVFASMVNASNCANLQKDKVVDGYLTLTPEAAFLREYL